MTAKEYFKTWEPRSIKLTPRYLKFIKLMMHGLTNKEIAKELNTTPNTAKKVAHDIYSKYPDVTTRNGMVKLAWLQFAEDYAVERLAERVITSGEEDITYRREQ